MTTMFKRLCPHRFGWSYSTHRRRRFCRVCGYQQRLERLDRVFSYWAPAESEEPQ